jgi:hypothetical protein
MGRHNHSSTHEHARKRGRHHNSRITKKDSSNNRLKVLSDPQGLGWSGA